jgi:transcriptional regulator with XRE-family HTH domain
MRARRNELGISLDELSFRCRIGVRQLGAYERGENQPGTANFTAIMSALEVELPWEPDSGDSPTARESSFPDWPMPHEADDLTPALAGG